MASIKKGELALVHTVHSVTFARGGADSWDEYQLMRCTKSDRRGVAKAFKTRFSNAQIKEFRQCWALSSLNSDRAESELGHVIWKSVEDAKTALTPYLKV